ncbi:GTP 3',8-cyclase MoaA [Desulforapulum autotrophicum]|nr:GTP 3',8-cyclase MoaA [Desulforapulum autotrophicum]
MDRYHRHLNYLRVSITDRCNLRCLYCIPDGIFPMLSHEEILTYEEILRIVKTGSKMGISKVRITGGEPLVRKGACDFLSRLSKIKGLLDISLTTNGVLLEKNIEQIKAAGIHRINVSLDTLQPKKYKQITRMNMFKRVWDGIMAAHAAGFSPIKLNVVVMKGINDDEIEDLARLTFTYPFHVRFIEYMPIGPESIESGRILSGEGILKRLSVLGELLPIENIRTDGPARRYRYKGAPGEIGLIFAMSNPFCSACNRLRLTASGQIRPCLLSDEQIDLKGPMRNGCTDEELAGLFIEAARTKKRRHHLGDKNAHRLNGRMSAIGG